MEITRKTFLSHHGHPCLLALFLAPLVQQFQKLRIPRRSLEFRPANLDVRYDTTLHTEHLCNTRLMKTPFLSECPKILPIFLA